MHLNVHMSKSKCYIVVFFVFFNKFLSTYSQVQLNQPKQNKRGVNLRNYLPNYNKKWRQQRIRFGVVHAISDTNVLKWIVLYMPHVTVLHVKSITQHEKVIFGRKHVASVSFGIITPVWMVVFMISLSGLVAKRTV